jgi:hypothetical protein
VVVVEQRGGAGSTTQDDVAAAPPLPPSGPPSGLNFSRCTTAAVAAVTGATCSDDAVDEGGHGVLIRIS